MRFISSSAVRHPKSVWLIVSLCVFGLWCAATNAAGATLSDGRRIIRNRGLQIQAMTDPAGTAPGGGWSTIDRDMWLYSNFTTINFWQSSAANNLPVMAQLPAGFQWSRNWEGDPALPAPGESPYINQLASFQYRDEQEQTPAVLAAERDYYAYFRAAHPNSLVYTNFGGNQFTTVAGLRSYMDFTKPNMISFDRYPIFSFPTPYRNSWYSDMHLYRTAGLEGYTTSGGGNSGPIPYAQFLALSRTGLSYTSPLPSESFVRLQQNASWAFGYSMVNAYVYNGWDISVMFNSPGQSQPTPVFGYVAEANRQSRNLGPALVRLVSTDVRMIPSSGGAPVGDKGFTQWNVGGSSSSKWLNAGGVNTGGYIDCITSIIPVDGQGAVSGTYDDVLVGYFTPLESSDPNYTFVDGLKFMIVNGSAGTPTEYDAPGDPATASGQWYRLALDFTGTDFDALVLLSRDTGLVEAIPLTFLGGREYLTYTYLEGGTGDLFGFWNSSNPLPTIPEPNTFAMLLSGILGVLAWSWRKRKWFGIL